MSLPKMAYHNILSKNDRALVAYLISLGAGTAADVFPAKRSLDREGICTVCWSEKAAELVLYSGTFSIEASIMVRSMAALNVAEDANAPRLASEARIKATFDAFFSNMDSAADKLGDDITAAARALALSDPANHADLADYTCLNVIIKGVEAGVDGDSWVDTFNLEIEACPSNISD